MVFQVRETYERPFDFDIFVSEGIGSLSSETPFNESHLTFSAFSGSTVRGVFAALDKLTILKSFCLYSQEKVYLLKKNVSPSEIRDCIELRFRSAHPSPCHVASGTKLPSLLS